MSVRAAEMVRRPGLFRAENDTGACKWLAAAEWHDSDRLLARIIHEYLLQQPIPSPSVAFLIRSPRRTARNRGIKKRPAHHLAGAHKRGALYSSRRAPCEKPRQASISAASRRYSGIIRARAVGVQRPTTRHRGSPQRHQRHVS